MLKWLCHFPIWCLFFMHLCMLYTILQTSVMFAIDFFCFIAIFQLVGWSLIMDVLKQWWFQNYLLTFTLLHYDLGTYENTLFMSFTVICISLPTTLGKFFRAVGSDDVSITITHCGVCYADVIWTRNKHGDSKYPLVPGYVAWWSITSNHGSFSSSHVYNYLHFRHEIVGIVKEVGHNVSRFKVGDHVGVGTYVNSCRDCKYCNDGLEVHCARSVYTFNAIDADGTITKGGYSSYIVVHERQVVYDA